MWLADGKRHQTLSSLKGSGHETNSSGVNSFIPIVAHHGMCFTHTHAYGGILLAACYPMHLSWWPHGPYPHDPNREEYEEQVQHVRNTFSRQHVCFMQMQNWSMTKSFVLIHLLTGGRRRINRLSGSSSSPDMVPSSRKRFGAINNKQVRKSPYTHWWDVKLVIQRLKQFYAHGIGTIRHTSHLGQFKPVGSLCCTVY